VVSPAKKTVEDIRNIPLLEITWKSWDEERDIDLGNGDPVILASNCEVTHIGSGYERIGEIVSDINSARQDGMTYDLHGSENRAFVKEHDEIMIHIPDGMVYLEPKTA